MKKIAIKPHMIKKDETIFVTKEGGGLGSLLCTVEEVGWGYIKFFVNNGRWLLTYHWVEGRIEIHHPQVEDIQGALVLEHVVEMEKDEYEQWYLYHPLHTPEPVVDLEDDIPY